MKLVYDEGPFLWPVAFGLENGSPYLVTLFWREGPQLDGRGPMHLLLPIKTMPEIVYEIARDAGRITHNDEGEPS